MAKLTKKEIKAWYHAEIVELIDSFHDTGIPSIFSPDELKELEQLKAGLLARINVNIDHNHTACAKLDSRLTTPT